MGIAPCCVASLKPVPFLGISLFIGILENAHGCGKAIESLKKSSPISLVLGHQSSSSVPDTIKYDLSEVSLDPRSF